MSEPNLEPAPADEGFDADLMSVFSVDGIAPEIPASEQIIEQPAEQPAPEQAPEPAPEAPPEAPAAPAALPGLEQPPSPAPAPAEPPAPAPAGDETALRLASQAAQLEAQAAEIARLKAAQTPPAPAPGTSPVEQAPEVAPYALSIPEPVAAAIFNEDPVVAKRGLDHLVNSLATIIHQKVKVDYQKEIADFRHELVSGDEQARQRAEAEAMQTDYFTAFPGHKAPIYDAIITQVAAQMTAEFPKAKWDENYRNTLGARVNAAIAEVAAGGQVPPAPAPAVTPTPAPAPSNVPAKPAAFVPTSPRNPLERNSEETTPDAVLSLFTAGD